MLREVIIAEQADEDTAPAALQRGGIEAGAFERVPGGLEQQPLLGIDGERLTGADTEEAGVEAVTFVEKAPSRT